MFLFRLAVKTAKTDENSRLVSQKGEKHQQIRAEILVSPSPPSLAPPTQMWGGGGLLGQQSAFTDKQAQRGETGGYIRLTARGGGRQAI